MRTLLQRTIKDKEANLYPIWLMRQAGRYMPEYMAIKKASKGFLDMAFDPKKATEITLQPIKEFDMDAAIIFSDILVIPYGIGQSLDYTPGPKLGTFNRTMLDTNYKTMIDKCQPVYDAIKLTRQELDKDKSLIGFAGAPWTLYRYMTGNNDASKLDPFDGIEDIQKLTDLVIEHLSKQIEAGCDTVQIFDSWAGDLGDDHLIDYCFDPIAKIVETIRERHPDVGIIAFPRLIGNEIKNFSIWTDPDCTSLSDDIPISWIIKRMGHLSLQGGLPPNMLLEYSKEKIMYKTVPMLRQMKDMAYVVNLAHGVQKETPVESVRFLVDIVKRNRKVIPNAT